MRSSPQLTAFLRFVVEAVLEGSSDRIKGYVIAVEVLKRGAQFNPQIDPIVRVEATRLRRTLERYYAGEGAEDAIVIALPRWRCAAGLRHGGISHQLQEMRMSRQSATSTRNHSSLIRRPLTRRW